MTKIFLEIDIKIGKNLFRQGKRGFQGLANEKCLNILLRHILSQRQEFKQNYQKIDLGRIPGNKPFQAEPTIHKLKLEFVFVNIPINYEFIVRERERGERERERQRERERERERRYIKRKRDKNVLLQLVT